MKVNEAYTNYFWTKRFTVCRLSYKREDTLKGYKWKKKFPIYGITRK